MYKNRNIAVVIPCYNEEKYITKVIDTMPDFVDKIVVIDDHSTDNTSNLLKAYNSPGEKFVYIRHQKKMGVGKAIATGYKWCCQHAIDITAVMNGDGQMDPQELHCIINPIAEDTADYSKGNRFKNGHAWRQMSPVRYMGSAILTLFTKIVSGYWHVSDSQSGYTAISLYALKNIDLDKIYSGYGAPNDILVKLNVADCRVKDVPILPIYHKINNSKMRLYKVVFSISWLLCGLYFWRIKEKYVVRDFHPLVFFYLIAGFLLPAGTILGFMILYRNTTLFGYPVSPVQIGWVILCALFFISGFQFLLFAMWFDMDYNKHLYIFDNRRVVEKDQK